MNSLGWKISEWDWTNIIDIVTNNDVPNTDATVRDICINNSLSKGNTALTNDYGQLLSKDIFNNLTGMYYHYDSNGESFIYISNNDVSTTP